MWHIIKDKQSFQVSKEEAINRALEVFGTTTADRVALRVWLYLLANDELNNKIAGLKYASIDSGLERLKGLGMIVIEEDNIYPVMKQQYTADDIADILEDYIDSFRSAAANKATKPHIIAGMLDELITALEDSKKNLDKVD